MFKYTTYTLKKIENIFEEQEYTIRYAKGNFKAGYCIVETKNVIVINKFFDTEARINSLLDVMANVEINEEKLSEKPLEFYKKLKKKVLGERREERNETREEREETGEEREETRDERDETGDERDEIGEEREETGDEREEIGGEENEPSTVSRPPSTVSPPSSSIEE